MVSRRSLAMVSRRSLSAEDLVLSQASTCGNFGGRSGTGSGFLLHYFGFPVSFHHCSILSFVYM
jgi:hypothetical protein